MKINPKQIVLFKEEYKNLEYEDNDEIPVLVTISKYEYNKLKAESEKNSKIKYNLYQKIYVE